MTALAIAASAALLSAGLAWVLIRSERDLFELDEPNEDHSASSELRFVTKINCNHITKEYDHEFDSTITQPSLQHKTKGDYNAN